DRARYRSASSRRAGRRQRRDRRPRCRRNRDPRPPAPNPGSSPGRCQCHAWEKGRSATSKSPRRVSNFGQGRQAIAKGAPLGAWMPECRAMQDIIRQKNLEHFRSLLRRTSDREERLLILMLLAEEQLKEPRPQKAANDD